MRCLYCGKKLALLRKLADSEFCTNSHRRLYQQEQEKMALSRLVEAQDRFSSYEPSKAAVKPRVNGVHREPITANDEEIRGFLSHLPRLQMLDGMRTLPSTPELEFGHPMVPQFSAEWKAEPSCSGRVDIGAFAVKSFEFNEIRSVEPLPEPVFSAVKPSSNAILAVAGLGGGLRHEWEWDAVALPSATLVLETNAVDFGTLRVVPSSVVTVVTTVPGGGRLPLDASPLEDFRPLVPVLAFAESELKPLKSFPRNILEITSFPVSSEVPEMVEPELEEPVAAKPDEIPSGLVRIKLKDAPLKRNLPIRKTRVREVFFPLPQLGGLSTMAAGVARASALNDRPRNFEIAVKPWLVQPSFDPQPQAFETRQIINNGGEIILEPAKPQVLPGMVSVASAASGTFGMGGRAEMKGFGFVSAEPGMRSVAVETAGFEMTAPAPPMSVAPPAGGIGICEASPMRVPEAACSPAGHRSFDLAWAETLGGGFEHVQYPASRVIAHSVELRGRWTLAAIEGIAQGDFATRTAVIEAQEVEAQPLPIVCPVSRLRQDFAPAAIPQRCLYYDSDWGGAVSPSSDGPSKNDMTPLYPEPLRLLPRLRTSVVEDQKVREAARAALAMFGEAKNGWTSRIHIPMPSLPAMPQLNIGRPDLKWFMMLVPLLLLIGVYNLAEHDAPAETASAGPAVTVGPVGPAVPVEGTTLPVAAAIKEGNFVTVGLENLKQSIKRRAAIALSDDFRGGLAEWEGRGDWSKTWSYDQAGFLRTGPLALYQPSMSLSDYHLDFLGQIEKKSLSWVFRAADLDNHYVTKITLTRTGPMAQAIVEHYAVINGKQSAYTKRPLPMMIQADTLYRVRMDVQGSDFTLLVQGQIVDHWSDNRLKVGGIGFFSAKGEQSLLRWVEISHQYDTIGKLCAFLAPYSIPAREGSSK